MASLLASKEVDKMARKIVLVSDISGKEADEDKFTKIVIRRHPAVEDDKQLDVLVDEAKTFKSTPNLVTLEVDKKTVVITLDEFRKLVPDEVVANAAGTRGRRTGFSPKPKS